MDGRLSAEAAPFFFLFSVSSYGEVPIVSPEELDAIFGGFF